MVWMNVDVDLGEATDGELIDEIKERGYRVIDDNSYDLSSKHHRLYEAFKLGKTDEAMEIAREIAQDETGRIL